MTRTHIISMAVVVAVALASGPVIAKKVSQAEVQKLAGRIAAMQQKTTESELPRYGQPYINDRLMWLDQLSLSDGQQQAIQKLKHASRKNAEALHDELLSIEGQLRRKWSAPEPDRRAILSLQRHVHQLLAAIAENRTQVQLDVLALLTPAQRDRMQTLQSDQCRSDS